jgi:hypothetical protein
MEKDGMALDDALWIFRNIFQLRKMMWHTQYIVLAPSKCCRSNNTDEAISSLLKRPGLDKKMVMAWEKKKRKKRGGHSEEPYWSRKQSKIAHAARHLLIWVALSCDPLLQSSSSCHPASTSVTPFSFLRLPSGSPSLRPHPTATLTAPPHHHSPPVPLSSLTSFMTSGDKCLNSQNSNLDPWGTASHHRH